jgi:hypothetical protein
MTRHAALIFVLALAAGVAGASPVVVPRTPATVGSAGVQSPPVDVKAVYRVYRNGFPIGKTEEHFVRDGNRYRIVSETAPDGALSLFLRDKLTVTSEGNVGGDGLQPMRFESTRQSDSNKTVRATFDWNRKIMESEHGGKIERVSLLPGTQDRLSSMYQFIKTQAGEFKTVHYARDAKSDEDEAEIWLAVEQHFLPVRVVFKDRKGATSEQMLVSLATR